MAVLSAFPSSFALACGRSKEQKKHIRRVTIETERTLILRNRSGGCATWCTHCGVERYMVRLAEAAAAASLTERAVCRLIESGLLHFVEDEHGRLFVCRESVEQFR